VIGEGHKKGEQVKRKKSFERRHKTDN